MKFFSQLPAKRQFQIMLIGIILLFLFAYQFSFKRTIELIDTYQSGLSTMSKAANAPEKIANYKSQINLLEASLKTTNYDRETLFDAIHLFCVDKNLSLSNFLPEQKKTQGELELITSPIEVSGGYFEIVQLAYFIEQEEKLGHIASIDFEKKKNLKTKKEKLIASIYLQNVFPKEKNNRYEN